ncbi:hypothetical protein GCM10008932_20480 [Alkalibacterium iburiense]|uniref:Uncharacterized protein n=1 Tax=Alkalibacterium iburiense TaxID=290589 RepID=A0ABN0XNL7_9LACT
MGEIPSFYCSYLDVINPLLYFIVRVYNLNLNIIAFVEITKPLEINKFFI